MNCVGDHFFLGEPIAVDLGGGERMQQPVVPAVGLRVDRVPEVRRHVVDGFAHRVGAGGIVLEVPEQEREGARPARQLRPVGGGETEHLARHDRGQRHREVCNHVHRAPRFDGVEQLVDDVGDVRA